MNKENAILAIQKVTSNGNSGENGIDNKKQQLVQVKLSQRTINSVESLKNLTGITSRTHLIASSIRLTESIMRHSVNGARIWAVTEDGQAAEITISL